MTSETWWDTDEALDEALWEFRVEVDEPPDQFSLAEWDKCAELAVGAADDVFVGDPDDRLDPNVTQALRWLNYVVVWAHHVLNDEDVRAVLKQKERAGES